MSDSAFISDVAEKILNREKGITFEDSKRLLSTDDIITLSSYANAITRKFNGDRVDVESLINAKSGNCPEDCSFCAQSSFYDSGITKYPLLNKERILEKANIAKENGSSSFCLVCAYKSPPEKDFHEICEIIQAIKSSVDIEVNVSLGFMTPQRARKLKSLNVKRYNHNLETSESYFSQICRTHDFHDRLNTARIVKAEGLELCCGGIIGMGETPIQRIELAFSIASLRPDEVPLNILIPKQGTPFHNMPSLHPMEIIKTIAIWRFIIPKTILKIAGGREVHLGDTEEFALKAGANGIITGGYLTTTGNHFDKDISMIRKIGLKV
jgi:biotin synthase